MNRQQFNAMLSDAMGGGDDISAIVSDYFMGGDIEAVISTFKSPQYEEMWPIVFEPIINGPSETLLDTVTLAYNLNALKLATFLRSYLIGNTVLLRKGEFREEPMWNEEFEVPIPYTSDDISWGDRPEVLMRIDRIRFIRKTVLVVAEVVSRSLPGAPDLDLNVYRAIFYLWWDPNMGLFHAGDPERPPPMNDFWWVYSTR